jgi:hypothetical protein
VETGDNVEVGWRDERGVESVKPRRKREEGQDRKEEGRVNWTRVGRMCRRQRGRKGSE